MRLFKKKRVIYDGKRRMSIEYYAVDGEVFQLAAYWSPDHEEQFIKGAGLSLKDETKNELMKALKDYIGSDFDPKRVRFGK